MVVGSSTINKKRKVNNMITYECKISERDEDITCYAYSEGNQIGYIATRKEENHVEIFEIWVNEEFRRRGIGSNLIDKVIEILKEIEHINCLYVSPHPLDVNKAGVREVNSFYLDYGFKPIDEKFSLDQINQKMMINV